MANCQSPHSEQDAAHLRQVGAVQRDPLNILWDNGARCGKDEDEDEDDFHLDHHLCVKGEGER